MDTNQIQRLRDMADAAKSGVWPPYLGILETERVYELGDALTDALDDVERQIELVDAATADTERAEENAAEWKEKIDAIKEALG